MNYCKEVKETLTVYEIYTCIETNQESGPFELSDNSDLEISGIVYSLRFKIEYSEDGLISKVSQYQPEGMNEIKIDDQLLKNLRVPEKMNWEYLDGKLLADSDSIEVERISHDFLKSNEGGMRRRLFRVQ